MQPRPRRAARGAPFRGYSSHSIGSHDSSVRPTRLSQLLPGSTRATVGAVPPLLCHSIWSSCDSRSA